MAVSKVIKLLNVNGVTLAVIGILDISDNVHEKIVIMAHYKANALCVVNIFIKGWDKEGQEKIRKNV